MESMTTRQKALFATLIVAAGVLFYVAVVSADGNPPDQAISGNPAIEDLVPARNDEVLAQTEVAIVLAPEYAGRILQIADTVIPYDGDGNVAPGTPNPRNRWSFRPGPGKVLERLPSDTAQTCVLAQYWPANDPDDISTEQWCFSVT